MEGFIETYTGRTFYLEDPKFSIFDIAAALENTCRFGGHIHRFYSVAAHSVLVARIMEFEGLGDPLEGLLHDAPEAYIGDMPTPFKQYFPDFMKMDHALDQAMRKQFKLPEEKTPGCCTADTIALVAEARTLQESKGKYIQSSMVISRDLEKLISRYQKMVGLDAVNKKGAFMEAYNRYLVRRYEPDAQKDQKGVRSSDKGAAKGDVLDF